MSKGPTRRGLKSEGTESRSNLLTKIKYLEDELTRMDADRNRLLHQLDKVCEEKDDEIKKLKGTIYEKNIEFDHQMNLAKDEKKSLQDEILDVKSMMAFLKAASENDVHQLAEEKSELINKLEDLKEYMDHKEETMDRIKGLEDQLTNEKMSCENKIREFRENLDLERLNLRNEITKEVEEISRNLEETCMRKLAGDAKLALEKVCHLSSKLEETERKLEQAERDKDTLRQELVTKRMRMDVAESLLQELLKQMSRKINARKDVGIQAYVVTRRNAESRKIVVLPP